MFEKEAEEHTKKNFCGCCPLTWKNQCKNFVNCGYHDSWKDGAEFGYNKANEWHFVKDGEYPKDDKKVLCILGDFENDNLKVGYYSQVKGDSKRWRFNDYDLPDDSEEDWGVSAWKEIVLPKESE